MVPDGKGCAYSFPKGSHITFCWIWNPERTQRSAGLQAYWTKFGDTVIPQRLAHHHGLSQSLLQTFDCPPAAARLPECCAPGCLCEREVLEIASTYAAEQFIRGWKYQPEYRFLWINSPRSAPGASCDTNHPKPRQIHRRVAKSRGCDEWLMIV